MKNRLWACALTALIGCGDDAVEPVQDTTADVAVAADEGSVLDEGAGEDVVVPPEVFGVGYRLMKTTYTPKGLDEARTINLSVWYPTRDTTGLPTTYQGILPRETVYTDAVPAEGGNWPVMVFSHGNASMAEQNFYLTEHLATRGWLVVAPWHTGNTFTDGKVQLTTDHFLVRPQDLTAGLDALEALPADDGLSGRVSDQVVVAGHSYGGHTALAWAGGTYAGCDPARGSICNGITETKAAVLAAGLGDPRVQLAITMSAGNYADLPDVSSVDVPVMFMSGALDIAVTDVDNGDPYWASLDGPDDVRINFTTAGHQTFSIACKFLGSLEEGDGCEGDQFMDPDEGYAAITTYAEAFIDFHLFGDADAAPIVRGETEVHPDVIVSLKP
ncbi:MAG: pimeloyl-ACP methyl ester carboxylesterase [Myxococcota bacterium]|jgi:pimeloyl-ACP methyl ester carboxylesterase